VGGEGEMKKKGQNEEYEIRTILEEQRKTNSEE